MKRFRGGRPMSPFTDWQRRITRRHFLGQATLGAAALATLLEGDGLAAGSALPHFAAKAKHVIYLFQSGGPSHLELLDYKPKLAQLHGSELPDSIRQGQRLTGMTSGQKSFPVIAPRFKFRQCGGAGTWVSELLPHTGRIIDELCLVRS